MNKSINSANIYQVEPALPPIFVLILSISINFYQFQNENTVKVQRVLN